MADPALPVQLHLGRSGRPGPHHGPVLGAAVGDLASIWSSFRSKAFGSPQGQAAFGVLGDVGEGVEAGSVARRKDDPPFDVQGVLVPPDEPHRHSSLRSALSGARAPPLSTTSRHYIALLLHRQPPDRSRRRFRSTVCRCAIRRRAVSRGVAGPEGRPAKPPSGQHPVPGRFRRPRARAPWRHRGGPPRRPPAKPTGRPAPS